MQLIVPFRDKKNFFLPLGIRKLQRYEWDYIAHTAPELKGFSAQNLWRMKQFYEAYRNADEKLSTLLREISWSNNLTILSRTKSEEERSFYLQLCVKERLSYRDLNRQIDSALFERAMLEKPKLSPLLREYIKIRHKALTECVHWGERRHKSYFLGLPHILICGKRRQPPDRALGAKKHNHNICCRGSDLLIMDCRFRRMANKRDRKSVDRR